MSQLEALGALEAAPMTQSALLTALRLVREETFTVGHLPAIIRLQLHQDVSINWRKLFRKSPFWQAPEGYDEIRLGPESMPVVFNSVLLIPGLSFSTHTELIDRAT